MSVYSDLVIADGPLQYWRCDEASGDLANAIAAGGARTFTANGAVTYSEATYCDPEITAVGFPGASTAYFATNGSVPAQNTMSWEFLIYCTDLSHRNMFLNQGIIGTDVTNEWEMQVDTAGAILLSANNSTNAETLPALSVDTWYHCIATYDSAATPKAKWYINGVLQTLNTNLTTNLNLSTANLIMGRDANNGTTHFHGRMDEVSFYTFTMAQAMVTAHFNALCTADTGGDVWGWGG